LTSDRYHREVVIKTTTEHQGGAAFFQKWKTVPTKEKPGHLLMQLCPIRSIFFFKKDIPAFDQSNDQTLSHKVLRLID
jgi:hypothetical protein